MCYTGMPPASTFLLGLMCLTALSDFAKTSADFSGKGEVPMPSDAYGWELFLQIWEASLGSNSV